MNGVAVIDTMMNIIELRMQMGVQVSQMRRVMVCGVGRSSVSGDTGGFTKMTNLEARWRNQDEKKAFDGQKGSFLAKFSLFQSFLAMFSRFRDIFAKPLCMASFLDMGCW